MFRILIVLAFASFFYLLYGYFKANEKNISDWKNILRRHNIMRLCLGIHEGNKENLQKLAIIDWFFCASILLTFFSFLILVLTGFLPVLFTAQHLSGIFLILHVTVAPLFVLAATIAILLIVHKMRFNIDDWKIFKNESEKHMNRPKIDLYRKIDFWIAFPVLIASIISIILMLFPLFGSEGQELLLEIHRYSTLALFILFLHQILLSYRS